MKFRKSRKFRPVRVVRLGGHGARVPATEPEAAASEAITVAPKSTVSVNASSLSRSAEVREHQGKPYDEALLEKSRTQWQFGDWQSLTSLSREKVEAHPERAKLALLVAAAYQQVDNLGEVRIWIRLARTWGCSNQLLGRVLVAGVYQTLARAALIAQADEKVEKWLHLAVSTGMPGSEARLWRKARYASVLEQVRQLSRGSLDLDRQGDAWSFRSPDGNGSLTSIPQVIVCHGMMRSGSTVAMNIICDLLSAAGVSYVKYYVDDFPSTFMLRDHIIQNKQGVFIIKTHRMDSAIASLVSEVHGKYLYTKRNILEVAASFCRMANVPNSPFFRGSAPTLEDLLTELKTHIFQYAEAVTLKPCKILDCDEFTDTSISSAVQDISHYLGLSLTRNQLIGIARNNSRTRNAIYSSLVETSQLTSRGHQKDTFFHVNHVMREGTRVGDYLPQSWRDRILSEFSEFVNSEGELRSL